MTSHTGKLGSCEVIQLRVVHPSLVLPKRALSIQDKRIHQKGGT